MSNNKLPMNVGTIFFTGIGGIGMSGIAEILHDLGYKVRGSDAAESANVERLRAKGIDVVVGQKEGNIGDAAVLVISSAVKDINPEVVEARKRGIAVIKRADMLAEIMKLQKSIAIAGTHGKTTTTSLVTSIFDAAKVDPTVINGGIINAYGTNARLGKGDWVIAEADESDGSFLRLPATIGVITNIDPEHMETYGSFDNLRDAFKQFIEKLPFYGFGVLCKDHPETAALAAKIIDRKIITYGIDSEADVKAVNIRLSADRCQYDVKISSHVKNGGRVIKDIVLTMPGIHNVLNSLSAIAIAAELEMSDDVIKAGLGNFGGVQRRFTKTGEVDGVTIIDDYGHHPKEIMATLKTARQVIGNSGGSITAVFQPHRYTRVRDLFDEFCNCFMDADKVIVSDVYPAGESPISGIDKDNIIKGIKKSGKVDVYGLSKPEELPEIVKKLNKKGDFVVFLGAGSVSKWANDLPKIMNAK